MKTTHNIYIDALKFAANSFHDGVSYNDIKAHLIKCGWKIGTEYENYLRYWFHSNFYNPKFELARIEGQQMWSFLRTDITSNDEKKMIMMAAAYEMLQDYDKLEETKKSAVAAKWIAVISIIITGVFAMVQIIVQIWTSECFK